MSCTQKALDYLSTFRRAFEGLDHDTAFERLVAALRADPVVAWHEVVRSHTWAFHSVVGDDSYFDQPDGAAKPRGRHRHDVMVGCLEWLYRDHPQMVCVPPSDSTEDSLGLLRKRRAKAIDDGLPYFVFIPQAKSGSTSFGNIIPNGFQLPCVTYSMPASTVIPSWARDCARGGGAHVTHLRPHAWNIGRFRDAGLRKLVVHTRDPRQMYLSLLHHYERYRIQTPHLEHEGYYSLSFADKARSRLSDFDAMTSWIAGWMEAAHGGGLEILFTTFEDFVLRKEQTIERLLAFYGGDVRRFRSDLACKRNDDMDYHFRSGLIDEWRQVFGEEVIDYLNARIPESWFDRFRWDP